MSVTVVTPAGHLHAALLHRSLLVLKETARARTPPRENGKHDSRRDKTSGSLRSAPKNAPSPFAQTRGVSSLQLDRLDFGDVPSGVVTLRCNYRRLFFEGLRAFHAARAQARSSRSSWYRLTSNVTTDPFGFFA